MAEFDNINCLSSLYARKFPNMMTSWNGNIFRVTGHLCGEFTGDRWIPAQRPVTRSFDVFFDLRLNKRLSKQSWGWWFETPSRSLWRHCNEYHDAQRNCEVHSSWPNYPLYRGIYQWLVCFLSKGPMTRKVISMLWYNQGSRKRNLFLCSDHTKHKNNVIIESKVISAQWILGRGAG